MHFADLTSPAKISTGPVPALRDQGAQRAPRGKASNKAKASQSAQLFNENLVLLRRGWKV